MPGTRTKVATLAVTLLLGARALGAQATPAASFKPLEFLVGSCWIGTFPDGKQTDEHCFEWVYERKFIRDRHVVRGGQPYEGETTYYVDPKTSAVTYSYISSGGLVITGTLDATKEGLVFPSRYSTPTGEVELKAIWRQTGPDAYKVTSTQRSGEAWKELWSMDMRRKAK